MEETNTFAILVAILVAVVGAVGVLIGALITALGNILLHYLQNKPRKELEKHQKVLLAKMLDSEHIPNKWRKLETLSRVIGADDETTKRLLIEIEARGSESESNVWGFIKHHPLDKIESA